MKKSVYYEPNAVEIHCHLRRVVCQSLTGGDIAEYESGTIGGGDDFDD